MNPRTSSPRRSVTGLVRHPLATALGFGAIVLPGAPIHGQDIPGGRSRAELEAVGQRLFDRAIEEYGLAADPTWEEDFQLVFVRLQPVLERPDLDIRWAIVDEDVFNAFASGDRVVFYSGILGFFEEAARQDAPDDPERQRERFRAYLAAVLGHELAHITLGHTGLIADRVRSALGEDEYRALIANAPGEERYETERSLDLDLVEELAYGRDMELAADAMGALYALRAGWEIQDAMDLFRKMDAAEREDEEAFFDIRSTTYLRTHPRSSAREASLEAFRAELKFDQTRLDDAIALIRSNTELDEAIGLLDTVLEHFPDLLAARHARGSAYHRKWLNTVPIQFQQLRASFPTFSYRLIGGIRGEPGDVSLLERARADYETVLAVERIPVTMASLALLDIYMGRATRARELAARAAELAPEDPEILNNVGVVRFLAGDPEAAADAFQRAMAASETPPASLVFNLGTTLLALGEEAGRELLYEYVKNDATPGWRQMALRLLQSDDPSVELPPAQPAGETGPVTEPGTGPVTETEPPEVAGLALGMAFDQALSGLGEPVQTRELESGGTVHSFESGLVAQTDAADRVVAIGLLLPESGSLLGLRVGDSVDSVDDALGPPSDRDSWGMYYDRGSWYIAVGYTGDTVVMLTVGLTE